MEAFARNRRIAIEWAEPKVRKEDYVRSALRRMERANRYGVYFILKSMEQGQTFRSTVPRFATDDPNYRILARRRSRFTHYYFYIRDETLGPMGMRVASFFPFQARDRARRQTLRLPADRQGNRGRSHLCAPTHQPASSQQ